MKLDNIRKKLKNKSFSQIIAKIVKKITRFFFVKAKCHFLKFGDISTDKGILDRYNVKLKIISPDEINLLTDREFYSERIWKDRWRQGAQLLGALWNGKIIEYCWIISDVSFRDIFDGFSIKLNPGEGYAFDYRSLKGKPSGLGSFRLMKVITRAIFSLLKKRFPNYNHVIYSTVEESNRVSLFFFRRYLKAELIGDVMMYKFLCWRWSKIIKTAENEKDY